MAGQPKAKSDVFGPFEMSSLIAGDVVPFHTLPYAEVSDSTVVMAVVSDNTQSAIVASAQPNAQAFYAITHVELAIFGSVQGYQVLLKRQATRLNYGPFFFTFGSEDVYDQIVFKGRLFVGGKPGFPANIVLVTATPLSIQVVVNVCRRGQ